MMHPGLVSLDQSVSSPSAARLTDAPCETRLAPAAVATFLSDPLEIRDSYQKRPTGEEIPRTRA